MAPDIVEIKRLCSSGQWLTRIENGKVLLHDAVSGETVCIGQTSAEPVRHGRWSPEFIGGYNGIHPTYYCECSVCKKEVRNSTYFNYCPNCGAKMDGDVNAVD